MPVQPQFETIKKLREDALARGLNELAIIYGWSMIRMNFDELSEFFKEPPRNDRSPA